MASLCFVLVGVMAGNGGQLAKLIVTGLLLGCIADVLLNLRWVFPKKGQLIFLVGILVFLGGHVVYLAAVLPMADNWAVCVVVGVVLTALLMWIALALTIISMIDYIAKNISLLKDIDGSKKDEQ